MKMVKAAAFHDKAEQQRESIGTQNVWQQKQTAENRNKEKENSENIST